MVAGREYGRAEARGFPRLQRMAAVGGRAVAYSPAIRRSSRPSPPTCGNARSDPTRRRREDRRGGRRRAQGSGQLQWRRESARLPSHFCRISGAPAATSPNITRLSRGCVVTRTPPALRATRSVRFGFQCRISTIGVTRLSRKDHSGVRMRACHPANFRGVGVRRGWPRRPHAMRWAPQSARASCCSRSHKGIAHGPLGLTSSRAAGV